MTEAPVFARRTFVVAGTAALAVLAGIGSAAAIGNPEKTDLKVGAAVVGATFLPLYLAADRTWKEQGLDAELVSFRTDSEASQALVGGSIDVAVLSGVALATLVASNQPCIGFYAGFYQADFWWLSQPSIATWQDLKGSTVGVTGLGALTDELTRYVLKKQGLTPEQDVKIVQVGPGASGLQALRSGRIGAAILAPPYNTMAQAAGMRVLGTERLDIAPEWLREVFVAKTDFIERNPNSLKTLLRAHVSALRLAKADRAVAVSTLVKWLKLSPEIAGTTYEEIMPAYNERGALPPAGAMAAFWAVAEQDGIVTAPLPNSRLLDDRFIKSFDSWSR